LRANDDQGRREAGKGTMVWGGASTGGQKTSARLTLMDDGLSVSLIRPGAACTHPLEYAVERGIMRSFKRDGCTYTDGSTEIATVNRETECVRGRG
jgi:hypothetical protein